MRGVSQSGHGDVCFEFLPFFFMIESERSRSSPPQITRPFWKAKNKPMSLPMTFHDV